MSDFSLPVLSKFWYENLCEPYHSDHVILLLVTAINSISKLYIAAENMGQMKWHTDSYVVPKML